MTEIPRAQDQLFDAAAVGAREVRRARRRPPGLGRAHAARAGHACVAERARRARTALRKTLYPVAARRLRPQRHLRAERRAPAPAQDPDRRQRRHRRQLPARREGDTNRGITIGSGVFIGRNTILSCKNGDIDARRRRQHRLQLRDVLGQPRAHRPRHAARGVLLPDRRRSRLQRSVAAGARAGPPIRGRDHRRRRLARRGREDPRRRARSAIAPSSAPARSCATSVPAGAIAVGIPAKVVGQRGRSPRRERAGDEPGRSSTSCRSAITSAGKARACTA